MVDGHPLESNSLQRDHFTVMNTHNGRLSIMKNRALCRTINCPNLRLLTLCHANNSETFADTAVTEVNLKDVEQIQFQFETF